MKVNQQTTRHCHILSLQLTQHERSSELTTKRRENIKGSSRMSNDSQVNIVDNTTLNLESLKVGCELSLHEVESAKQMEAFLLFEGGANKITKLAMSLLKLERIDATIKG